jgi:type II secretory pathway pseudopilin PulG
LVVIAIIGMMVGLSALAVSGMRAPALQHAADQVMSGLSLARQIAITKNTYAALLIATNTSAGFPTNGPYRHWSVVYSNKGANTWLIAKDWEELPNGAFFLEILRETGTPAQAYNPKTTNEFTGYSVGQGFKPTNFPVLLFSKISAISGNTTIDVLNNQTIPCILFTSIGKITNAAGGAGNAGKAIRISSGNVMAGNATLTTTNQYYFVESDNSTGRIRMRAPESYTNN